MSTDVYYSLRVTFKGDVYWSNFMSTQGIISNRSCIWALTTTGYPDVYEVNEPSNRRIILQEVKTKDHRPKITL